MIGKVPKGNKMQSSVYVYTSFKKMKARFFSLHKLQQFKSSPNCLWFIRFYHVLETLNNKSMC